MSNDKKIPSQFVVRIAVKNESGAVVGHKDFVTLPGLVAAAHAVGLESIDTTLIQLPTDANGQTAVVRAVAKGKPGIFTGLGDANPKNVNRKVAPHILRVAESRAVGRALRLMANVHAVALEELGGDDDIDFERPQERAPVTRIDDRRDAGISDAQKRALWRKALALGYEGPRALAFLTDRLGVDPANATRAQASRLLDMLSDEERRAAANGAGGHAAE